MFGLYMGNKDVTQSLLSLREKKRPTNSDSHVYWDGDGRTRTVMYMGGRKRRRKKTGQILYMTKRKKLNTRKGKRGRGKT